MYRQFLVHCDDQHYQRILWRFSSFELINSCRLATVTYGTSCAPFLANACMLQLADDVEHQYPHISALIRKHRYVYDFFLGADTLEEANHLRKDLTTVLASAGLEVEKWTANQSDLLSNISSDSPQHESLFQDHNMTSSFGIKWLPEEDCFWFKTSELKLNTSITPSKRSIASDVAKLFDPLSWLASFMIRGKILLQQLWLLKTDWDDPVPDDVANTWLDFRSQLPDIETLHIPR